MASSGVKNRWVRPHSLLPLIVNSLEGTLERTFEVPGVAFAHSGTISGRLALAKLYNPIIQGWWNYYGAFYPTAMLQIYQHIDRALERWARRKYKALSGRQRASVQWLLQKMRNAEPQLFYHWGVVGSEVG